MESLGVNINLTPEAIAQCIEQVGVGFMFAPNHHPAMKNVAPVRREMGVKTMFNLLGPLTNPAGAPNILMGVFHPDLVGIQVRALERLGTEHAMVVYGKDGLDEVSLGAATMVGELKDGKVTEYEIHPEDFGMAMASTRAFKVETPEQSRAMLLGVLDNVAGSAKDIVVLNAGVALYAANVAVSIQEGIDKARAAIESGAAKAKLEALVTAAHALSAA
jgi:anthranilate phosphoribosyltransferase